MDFKIKKKYGSSKNYHQKKIFKSQELTNFDVLGALFSELEASPVRSWKSVIEA